MLDFMFDSVIGDSISVGSFFSCTVASLILGTAVALCYSYRNRFSAGFLCTLATLPAIVQVVIMLVNGNIGVGVAVAGTFSLVRFRSAQGTAKEISGIFLCMAAGLATGTGYIGVATLFTLIIILVNLLLAKLHFGESGKCEKMLKITVPESLDYNGAFDDLFNEYTDSAELVRVKTENMGSLYKLYYKISEKDSAREKEFIDAVRCRNGNLDIVCGREDFGGNEL